MSLLAMWLVGWAACSIGSAAVFAWWTHAMRLQPAPEDEGPRPRT
ncbi:MAG: hypothetical protein QOE35_180 [Actinomycetota bacterium]|jgi:hypothetical protein